MAPLLALLLPALLPAGVDIFKGLFGAVSRLITGETGAKPQNVEEAVKLMEADTARLKALADLDKPAATVSKWVSDLRASFRYIAAGLIILSGVLVVVIDVAVPGQIDAVAYDTMTQLMGSVFAFLFGDRLNLSLRRK
jgi:hypothetical protein